MSKMNILLFFILIILYNFHIYNFYKKASYAIIATFSTFYFNFQHTSMLKFWYPKGFIETLKETKPYTTV